MAKAQNAQLCSFWVILTFMRPFLKKSGDFLSDSIDNTDACSFDRKNLWKQQQLTSKIFASTFEIQIVYICWIFNFSYIIEALKYFGKALEMFDIAYIFVYWAIIFHLTHEKIKSCKKYHNLDLIWNESIAFKSQTWPELMLDTQKKSQIRMTPVKNYQI